MNKRLCNKFTQLQKEQLTAFIPFIMAGYPDIKTATELLLSLPENGADIIEIGIPFSDPMADGPTIEQAGLKALASGANLYNILDMVAKFRNHNKHTPIILMGYYNPIYRYDLHKFSDDAASAGVDGLIIVDLPPEEEAELIPHLHNNNLDLIRLVAPTTPTARQVHITSHASGFIYYISVKGITGRNSAAEQELAVQITSLRQHTKLPIAAGFGIKTPTQAAKIAKLADAVVVGSAIIELLTTSNTEPALDLVRAMAEAIHGGNTTNTQH